jgi:hypothetical protein
MEQSGEIVQQLNRFYHACVTGDVDSLSRVVPDRPGVLMIGTAPEEWWGDHATITSVARAQMAELGGSFPIAAGSPRAYQSGDVGWADDQPHLNMPDGTTVPLRLTAVFHRQEGEWKLVQSHFSIGVPNEEAFGQALPE